MSQQIPQPQRVSLSRRPIKATEPFGSTAVGGNSGKPSSLWSQGSPLPVTTPTGGKKGSPVDRRGSPVSGTLHSPKDAKVLPKVPGRGTPSPVTMVAGGVNPRRANSLNSLNDQDCYMNSVWPKATEKASQLEGNATGPPDQQGEDPASESRGGTKSHRRSNSYTYTTLEQSSQQSSQSRKLIPLGASGHRVSTESLEISNFLGGEEDLKKQLMENTESGRMAPVTELMSALSIGSQQQTPVPLDTPSTPPTSTPSSPLILGWSIPKTSPTQKSVISQSPGCREDSPEASYFTQKNPASPKPTFQREPPDGADKLLVKPSEPLLSLDERSIQAPDVSKVQIKFTPGGVFKPAAE